MGNLERLRRMHDNRDLVLLPRIDLTSNIEQIGPGLHRLLTNTKADTLHAVEGMALCFKRELRYDARPFSRYGWLREYTWSPFNQKPPKRPTLYLLTGQPTPKSRAPLLGVVGFSEGFYSDINPKAWTLTWAWIHPDHRRTGVLQAVWETLCELHGSFYIQPPYSDAMRGFLDKQHCIRIPNHGFNDAQYGLEGQEPLLPPAIPKAADTAVQA